MDFVTHLPRSTKGHDSVWVIIDRLTKCAHFLPMNQKWSMDKLAELDVREVMRLHGVPESIVSDRDPRFTSRFWQSLQAALGTQLRMSSAYHPQMDGQSEQIIQSLEDLLRSCVLDHMGNWNDVLLWWSSHTIIITTLALAWHLMKHCMEEGVELHCASIRMVKPLCLVLNFYNKRLVRSN